MLTETEVRAIKPVRYSRKVSDGGGSYLLVTPKGGRCWRDAYRFAQTYKTLALGTYPDVPLDRARSRHEFARNLLAHGLDPSALKAALGKHLFVVTMWEWEMTRSPTSMHSLGSRERNKPRQSTWRGASHARPCQFAAMRIGPRYSMIGAARFEPATPSPESGGLYAPRPTLRLLSKQVREERTVSN